MPIPGDIYHCKKIEDDSASDHWWVLLCVDADEVQYMVATSRIEPFLYGANSDDLQDPERKPDSAVFLDIKKIVGSDGRKIFLKPTILNCYHRPGKILRQNFNNRVKHSKLKKVGRLPDRYLAQIIPSVCCSNTWFPCTVKQVLHVTNGIGGCIDAFYSNLRQ